MDFFSTSSSSKRAAKLIPAADLILMLAGAELDVN
jgi:hypothetical protein